MSKKFRAWDVDQGWLLPPSVPDFVPSGYVAHFVRDIPRRWVIERTFAWLGRCRRMAKDWEKTIASAEAWLLIAHIRRVTRLLAKQ